MVHLELIPQAFMANDKVWTENAQWKITDNQSYVGRDHYSDGSSYDYTIFELTLKRKALFYYINILIPCLVISIVEMVIFSLPVSLYQFVFVKLLHELHCFFFLCLDNRSYQTSPFIHLPPRLYSVSDYDHS